MLEKRIKNSSSNVSSGKTTPRFDKHFALELWVKQTRWKANTRVLLIKGPQTTPHPPLAQSLNHSDPHTWAGRDLQTIQSLQPRYPSYKRVLPKGLIVTWEAHSAKRNNPQYKHIRAEPLAISTSPAVVHDTLFAHYSCVFLTQEWLHVASAWDLSLAKLPVFNQPLCYSVCLVCDTMCSHALSVEAEVNSQTQYSSSNGTSEGILAPPEKGTLST